MLEHKSPAGVFEVPKFNLITKPLAAKNPEKMPKSNRPSFCRFAGIPFALTFFVISPFNRVPNRHCNFITFGNILDTFLPNLLFDNLISNIVSSFTRTRGKTI